MEKYWTGGDMKVSKEKIGLAVTGIIVGLSAVILTIFGNPKNMGFCIACFVRDMAGAVKLHSAAVVQYMRPEVIGIVLGSFFLSLADSTVIVSVDISKYYYVSSFQETLEWCPD